MDHMMLATVLSFALFFFWREDPISTSEIIYWWARTSIERGWNTGGLRWGHYGHSRQVSYAHSPKLYVLKLTHLLCILLRTHVKFCIWTCYMSWNFHLLHLCGHMWGKCKDFESLRLHSSLLYIGETGEKLKMILSRYTCWSGLRSTTISSCV